MVATSKFANQQIFGKFFYSSTLLQNGLTKSYSTNVVIFLHNLRKLTKTM